MWRLLTNAGSIQLNGTLTADPNAGLSMGWQQLSNLMCSGCKQKLC